LKKSFNKILQRILHKSKINPSSTIFRFIKNKDLMFLVSPFPLKSKSYEFWKTFVVLEGSKKNKNRDRVMQEPCKWQKNQNQMTTLSPTQSLPFSSLSLGTGLKPARGSSQGLPEE
jgi:hypothetical protein